MWLLCPLSIFPAWSTKVPHVYRLVIMPAAIASKFTTLLPSSLWHQATTTTTGDLQHLVGHSETTASQQSTPCSCRHKPSHRKQRMLPQHTPRSLDCRRSPVSATPRNSRAAYSSVDSPYDCRQNITTLSSVHNNYCNNNLYISYTSSQKECQNVTHWLINFTCKIFFRVHIVSAVNANEV